MTITERLIPILERPISDEDRKRAALLLLDWTGCAVAGRREPAGKKAYYALQSDGKVDSVRVGHSPSGSLLAAMYNGMLGNVLEMDDVDKRAVLHAGPTIIPAALSLSKSNSTRSVLDAIVIGYEATIRIGRAVGTGHYAYWHNTATCGPFGAAVAACHLLPGSDPVSSLGLAGTQAAGLWQTRHEPDSMAKQLHAGHAAHAGVLAAMLSVQGFQGPRSILEGEQGFFAAMCPGANPEDILTEPDADWRIHETSLKPYPSCRHTHPAIDAALKAELAEGPIVIRTYSDAIKFCDKPNPLPGLEAKFSLQHSVAVTLLKGAPTLKGFEKGTVDDIEIKTLRNRIVLKEDAEFNAAYPSHYGASVCIGSKTYISKDAYGDPEMPMSEEAVMNKAGMLMEHGGMTAAKAKNVCLSAMALPDSGQINDFMRLLS